MKNHGVFVRNGVVMHLTAVLAAVLPAGVNPASAGDHPFRRAADTPGELRRQLANQAIRAYAGPRGELRTSGLRGDCNFLVDDFEDGDALGWASYSVAAGPTQASVQSNRLVLERSQGGDASAWQWFGLSWAASMGDFDTYYDGKMRLTFRINEPGNTFLAFGRGYLASFVVQYFDGAYYLLISDWDGTFAFHSYAHVPFDLQIGADYRMEASFVGTDLAMKVWKDGDREPARPQLHATSAHWGDPFLKYANIGVEMDGQFTADARRVEVDDITFCPLDADDPPVIDPNSIPVSGIPVPKLAIVDDLTRRYMALTHAKSIVHSWMKDGKVEYHRAFGWADEDQTEILQPDAMMRLASISKSFTAAAIRELVAERRLRMNDKVFDLGQGGGGILHIEPYPALGDERYKDMTVQHLVEHTSGWDRGAYGDVFWCDFHAARTLGVPMPISRVDRLRFILSTPLQYHPGTPGIVDSYSNVAYDVLGLIVEQVSGMPFEEYVGLKVLPKLGVARSETEAGRSFPQDFNPREPFYGYYAAGPNVFDEYGPWVRMPYGGWNHESIASTAGLIASNVALMGLASHRYLSGPKAGTVLPNHLTSNFFDFKNGSLTGTDADLLHAWEGGDRIHSILVNHRAAGEYFDADLNGGVPVHPGAAAWTLVTEGLLDGPPRKSGDVNCDGVVDSNDIGPFYEAQTDIEAYADAYPDCTGFNADMNGDLTVDARDIDGFFECLSHGGCD